MLFPRNGIRRIFTAVKSTTTPAVRMKLSAAFREINRLSQPEIKIRGRPFLAGSNSLNFPETIPMRSSEFLKAVEFQDNKIPRHNIGENVREYLDDCFSEDISAVYIRNLPIKNAQDFDELVQHLGQRPMTYCYGSAFRNKVQGLVYTASDEPPEFSIEPHNEMAYLENFPTKIIFCCIESAEEGGESPIVFNRDIFQRLDKTWVEKVRARGMRYLRNLKHEGNTDYISWQGTFDTKSTEVAEDLMQKQSMFWKWHDNGDLTMWYKGNVFAKHPTTGEEIWFNQITANHCSYYQSHPMYKDLQNLPPSEYSYHCTYGDGEEFEDELVDHIRSVTWQSAIPLKLHAGDILVLDNMLAQHTRMSYKGGNRKILVHLAESIKELESDGMK